MNKEGSGEELLLEVSGLKTEFATKKGRVRAVDGIDFTLRRGEILGIAGESGCGKSVTALSILRLLPDYADISSGSIVMNGRDLLGLSEDAMCDVRGNEIAMIFQDPMTSLNPVLTLATQMIEPFVIHQGMTKAQGREKALEMLKKVGISSPEQRLDEYPHQLSGGMRQRVMIAMALSCNPQLLIADEPTTALDVTTQAQILDLMRELRNDLGTAVMLITHDLGVVAEMADNVLVMYAGRAVEYSPAEELFERPKHPYTQGLLQSIPRLEEEHEILHTIPGTVPNQYQAIQGCKFRARCPKAMPVCAEKEPKPYKVGPAIAHCFLYAEGKGDE
jgi:oligopeptide/dipeptide ABC transporter ATP-binding protein